MAFSKEFTDQMAAINNLVESVTDLKVNAKMAAAVQVKMLELMARKGLITVEELDAFVREIEAGAAAMSKIAPETGKEMGDLALKLRNALFKETGKPN